MDNNIFYNLDSKEVIEKFNSDITTGLSNDQVEYNIKKYGHNKLQEDKKQNLLSKIISQFSDFLVIILIVSAIISFILGEKKIV